MGRAGPRLSRLARVRHHPRRAAATGRPAPRTARPANQTPPTGFATPYPNRHNTNRFRRDRITSPTSGTYIRPHLHRYWDATWEHWGRPEIMWYQGGHAGFLRSRPCSTSSTAATYKPSPSTTSSADCARQAVGRAAEEEPLSNDASRELLTVIAPC